MDRTDVYRRMAGASKEIQKLWTALPGDFAYLPWMESPMFGNYNGSVLTNDYTDKCLKGEATWIPRSDQIVEQFDVSLTALLASFYLWASGDARFIFSSLEQLWLGYFMLEKHKKEWNGKKWERVKNDKKI